MKKHLTKIDKVLIIVLSIVLCFTLLITGLNSLLTSLVKKINSSDYLTEKITTVHEAMETYGEKLEELNDISSNYCPPYRIIDSFED